MIESFAMALWIVVACYQWSILTEPDYDRLMWSTNDDIEDVGIMTAFIYYVVLAPGYLIMLCCELWSAIATLIKKGLGL